MTAHTISIGQKNVKQKIFRHAGAAIARNGYFNEM